MDQKETVIFFACYRQAEKVSSSISTLVCDKHETVDLFYEWLKKLSSGNGEMAFTNVKIIR